MKLLRYLLRNIHGAPLTTLLGVMLALIGLLYGILEKISLTEIAGFITVIVGLLIAPDPKRGNG